MNYRRLVVPAAGRQELRDTVRKTLWLWMAFALLVAVLVVVPSPSAFGAQTAGTVSGTVERNGRALAGVEVYLGVLANTSHDEEARYTCTGASGEFEFDGVPFDRTLISATGPEVQPAVPCANRKFVTHGGFPLVPQRFDGQNAGVSDQFSLSEAQPAKAIQYDVIRLPTRNRYLVFTARAALFAFYDLGNVDVANFFIGLYSQRVQRLIDNGRISGERADILAEYGDVISLVFAIG